MSEQDLILRMEYLSNGIILNSKQLKIITDKIIGARHPIEIINKYLTAKIINFDDVVRLKRTLKRFIQKNLVPEKGQKMYENWKVYNRIYEEVLKIVT